MSPMSGVNYLDKEFPQYLAEPVDAVFDNEDISAVGLCFKAFAEHGTSTWHRRTVEWFLIYLLTELGITPHPMRQGYNAPELNSAYSAVIQELKRRRFEKWAPNLTVQLVRKYLTCLDELTFVTLNLKLKQTLFESTLEDIKRFEEEDEKMGKPPDNPDGESAMERLEWAMATIKSDYDCFERLLVDLRQSLDAVRTPKH
ncbi:MAG: hypothetical protein LQ351_001348 [Letrouitia transgressa]|nr:MAG: hypothetical protein LQ351_001348 [Letrouitia transgressa]